MSISKEVLENFEQAFKSNGAGCVRDCPCGRTFYNPDGGWTWEEGELEELENNPKATAVDWACGTVVVEGQHFAQDCDCWHPRAETIIRFIEAHDEALAEFLSLEKERKTREAERSPVVR